MAKKMIPASIIVTGSLAYDHVMTYHGKFADHILPEKIHMLNVSFNIQTLDIDFGGTAGNIAYNLALLGQKPLIHATAGSDFDKYEKHLKNLKLPTHGIKTFGDVKTAQAFITTDLADNQIAAFHVGAMGRAAEHPLQADPESIVIIAPNAPDAMVSHAKVCQQNNLTFLFDPGQAFNALSADQLRAACKGAKALVVNDYEWQLWQNKTGLSEKQTLKLTEAVVVTLGEKGSTIITHNGHLEFPAVTGLSVTDPTGCGDAYRAGLLHGLSQGKDWSDCAKLGTVAASFCVEAQGPQGHQFSIADFTERAERQLGMKKTAG